MKLALIPARGGSKRIRRKNIRSFVGQPIISFTIAAARRTKIFDRVVVSTDDDEIANVARSCGAEVPFRRPAELASDTATTMDVIQHALSWFRNDEPASGYSSDSLVCCLYPAAPFILTSDVRQAHDLLVQDEGADYCFPVTPFPAPIQRALRILEDQRLEMFDSAQLNSRSQDLEPGYHDAAQFYWGRARSFEIGAPLFGSGAIPLVIPLWRVQDIDTEEDWNRAELLFELLNQRSLLQ